MRTNKATGEATSKSPSNGVSRWFGPVLYYPELSARYQNTINSNCSTYGSRSELCIYYPVSAGKNSYYTHIH